jgi:hypothetical protein
MCLIVLLLFGEEHGANATGNCSNCAGWWSAEYFTLDLTQSSGSVGGSATVAIRAMNPGTACDDLIYGSVSGTFSNGDFSITLSNPNESSQWKGDEWCPVSTTVSFDGSVYNGGCDTADADWSGDFGSGSTSFWKECDVPTSETISFSSWDDSYALFSSTLNGGNFAGRIVEETVGGAGSDGCHFAGSAYDEWTAITGGTWDTSGNSWGDDNIGWGDAQINYYRTERPNRSLSMPCQNTMPQTMIIYCNNYHGNQPYQNNTLHAGIDAGTIFSYRGSAYSGSHAY